MNIYLTLHFNMLLYKNYSWVRSNMLKLATLGLLQSIVSCWNNLYVNYLIHFQTSQFLLNQGNGLTAKPISQSTLYHSLIFLSLYKFKIKVWIMAWLPFFHNTVHSSWLGQAAIINMMDKPSLRFACNSVACIDSS